MTRRYLPLLALVLASGTVGADAHDEANRIHAEARELIAQQCRKDSCPVFAAATAKLKKAYAIEPDDMIAATYCSLLGLVKLTPEQEREMLAMCDAGDPDRAEALRAKRIEKGRASSALEAARALFGIGLTLSEPNFPKKGGETLAWGTVTAEKLQDYIRDHYVDVITTTDQLREPEKKLAACKVIAGHARDAAEKTAITQLCEFEVAREVPQDYLTFGGDSGLERVVFKSAPAFQQDAQLRYRPTFVLASKRRFDMYAPLTQQHKLLEAIVKQGSQHTYFKQASDMLAALDANIKKLTDEGVRVKKLLAANKTKVLFLPHTPKDWDVPAPLAAKADSCDRFLFAIGPDLKPAEDDQVALEVTVDGKPCVDEYGREGRVRDSCPDLFGKGEHKLAATMYRVKWKKTGEKQITVHKNSIDVRDKEQSSRGATVARGQLTCGTN
jgi:hypothetical protein